MEDRCDASERAEAGLLAKLSQAILKESSEAGARQADGSTDEVDPNEASIEPIGARRNVLKHMSELLNQCLSRLLAGVEAGNKAAQVDASSKSESSGNVLGQLFGRKAAIGIEGHLGARLVHLSESKLLTQSRDVLAESEVVHAVLLEGLEAGDLRDEVHDTIIAAHELPKAKVRVHLGQVLLSVGVRECGRSSLHGSTKNVDPGGQGHVEWGL